MTSRAVDSRKPCVECRSDQAYRPIPKYGYRPNRAPTRHANSHNQSRII